MKNRSLLSFSVLSLITVISPVMAVENFQMPEVLITAKRVAENQPSINAATTVITRQQIEQQQLLSLKDILQQQAGINIASNGGPLTATSIFMRGTSGKQVLILVDGVRVNDANQGSFDISLIRTDDIERVEIVRGPYSSQYGSDAIAGVIQIFTRKQQGVEVNVRAGRFNTVETSVNAGLGDKANGISLGVSHLDTDGFSATNQNSFSFNPDKDGGLSRTARLSGWATLSDDLSAKFSTSWTNSMSEFDDGVSDADFGTASAEATHKTLDQWTQRLQLGWTRTKLDTDAFFSRFLTERNSVSWLHDIIWAEGMELVAGIDYANEKAFSGDPINNSTTFDNQLQNLAVFASQYITIQKFSGSLSVRQEKHDTFGEHTTGSLNIGYQLQPSLKFFGAYGSAFRAPSANDLFHPGYPNWLTSIPEYVGNPNLKPERSHQAEIGAQYQWHKSHQFQATVYQNRVRDMIASDPVTTNMVNIDKSYLQGTELEASGLIDRINYTLNISLLSAKDDKGTELIRRPQSAVNALIGYSPADSINLGIELRARSSTQDGTNTLKGYQTGNVFAKWKATNELTLGARMENVNNKRYEEVYGYNTSPRSGYLSVNYALQ